MDIGKNDNDITKSSSINLKNSTSTLPSKSNLSPGEIKPISPSSLSETSPISNWFFFSLYFWNVKD